MKKEKKIELKVTSMMYTKLRERAYQQGVSLAEIVRLGIAKELKTKKGEKKNEDI